VSATGGNSAGQTAGQTGASCSSDEAGKHPADQKPAGQDSAADVARRVATELHQLSHLTSRIECAVSGLILNNPGAASDLHQDLQSLDSLGQMLEALAQFLNDMAVQIPPDWRFDPTHATSSIKLKDLAQRLNNQKESPEQINNQKQNNEDECHFF